jgi:N-acetylneuraminate synthase
MSSPFTIEAVELLDKLGMKRFKIASGEVTNHLMLEIIGRLQKPVIFSSGMSNYRELDHAFARMRNHHNNISVLQCTTAYPTPAERVGLNVLAELKERYNCPVGLSDHSARMEPMLAAVTLGATLLEAHIVFDKRMFGPDAKASLTVDEFGRVIEGVRFIETMLANPADKSDNSAFSELKGMFEKSLSVRRAMKAGDTLTLEDLETKKPAGYGIAASSYGRVIGKVLVKNIEQYDFLTEEHIG